MGTYPGGNVIRVRPAVVVGQTLNNDVMFDTAEIKNAVSSRGGVSIIKSITIIDNDAEEVDMDIIFMQVEKSFGPKDNVSNITDANLQESKVLGALPIDWSDGAVTFAQDAGSASICTLSGHVGTTGGSSLPMLLKAEEGSTSVYFTGIVRDSNNANYAATDDLEFVFHVQYID